MPDPTNSVYIVLRKDYGKLTNSDKGRLALPIGAYTTAALANEAAEAHCEAQGAKAQAKGGDPADGKIGEYGLYKGLGFCNEPRRANFDVFIKVVKLNGGKSARKGKKRKSEGAVEGEATKKREKAAANLTSELNRAS